MADGPIMGAKHPPVGITNVTLNANNPDRTWRNVHRDLWAATYFLPHGALVRVDTTAAPYPYATYYEWFYFRPDISWQFVGAHSRTWAFIASELTAGRGPMGPLAGVLK
jgi:hypothetical protein